MGQAPDGGRMAINGNGTLSIYTDSKNSTCSNNNTTIDEFQSSVFLVITVTFLANIRGWNSPFECEANS